jgi:hypothetical protein
MICLLGSKKSAGFHFVDTSEPDPFHVVDKHSIFFTFREDLPYFRF